MIKLVQILSEIYADEAIEKELSEYYNDPVIGFNQFTANELVKMYHRGFVVNKPSVKMVKNFKKFPCKKGLCYVNVYFGSKLMNNLKCWKGFAHDNGSWKAHAWAISRGTIIETTPVKRNAYYGIEIDCKDLEHYVKDSEKKEFEKFLTK